MDSMRHPLVAKVIGQYTNGLITISELQEEIADIVENHPCSCIGCLA